MRKALLPIVFVFAGLVPGISMATDGQSKATAQANITAIGDVKRGSLVSVHGTVERILDTDEFRIADASGDIKVYIGYRNFVPINVGEVITVNGFVDDDLFVELYAREIIHSDGRITQLHTSN